MMEYYVARTIPRSGRDREISSALEELGVSTINESQGKYGLFDPSIRPVSVGLKIAGPAITVKSLEGDNLMLHAAIDVARRDDVLVVNAGGLNNYGMFGELMGTLSIAKGIRALITESSVRDAKELRELGFPVWSHGVCSLGTSKNTPGWVNVPITCGGQIVNPGDFVVADDDGVVVVKRENVDDVISAAKDRQNSEAKLRHMFEKGESSMDLLNLRNMLKETGVVYRN